MEGTIMDLNKLKLLTDRMDITDTSLRYATGVDFRDRDIYLSCFTEEIEVDMSSMGMGPPMNMTAEAWVDQALSLVSGFQSTQHIITNHVITIEGDEATCVAYVQAQHFNPGGLYTVGGYYSNRLVRTSDGWRISKLKLVSTWNQNT
jgi:hypothetical protein